MKCHHPSPNFFNKATENHPVEWLNAVPASVAGSEYAPKDLATVKATVQLDLGEKMVKNNMPNSVETYRHGIYGNVD